MTAGTFRALVIAFRKGAHAGAEENAKWGGDDPDYEAREFLKSIDALIERDEREHRQEQSAKEWTRLLMGEAA